VSQLTVTSTAGVVSNGFTAAATATGGTATIDPITGAETTTLAPSLNVQIVNIDTSVLSVAIPPAVDSSGAAIIATPAVDLSRVVDAEPPVLTLRGPAYVKVLQATGYAEQGASAFDNLDGSGVQPRSQLGVCRRPAAAELWTAGDTRVLACNSSVFAAVNTSWVVPGWVWVYTYSARDAAGNKALPVRRIVEVASRCACGGFSLIFGGGWRWVFVQQLLVCTCLHAIHSVT